MLLQDFIKSNDNWEEVLSNAPYCLKITRDDGYVMFKYNQLSSDFSIPLVREARGIILREDDWAYVCVPFYKFGNFGESYVEPLDWEHGVSVQEKIDGSLCKLWHDLGKWHLSTNGSIDARKADLGNGLTFYDLFERALKTYGYESLQDFVDRTYISKRCTYMFELATEKNRVVIPYEGYHLYLLGVRCMIDCEEEYLEDNVCYYGIERPKCYKMECLEDVIFAANQLPWDEEGYVCVDTHFNRCKVKSPAYVEAHYNRNNNVMTDKRLIYVILAGEEAEFSIYCRDYMDRLEEIKSKMEELEVQCLRAGKKFGNSADKRSVVEATKTLSPLVKAYCLWAYGRETGNSFQDFTKTWSPSKWEKALNGK